MKNSHTINYGATSSKSHNFDDILYNSSVFPMLTNTRVLNHLVIQVYLQNRKWSMIFLHLSEVFSELQHDKAFKSILEWSFLMNFCSPNPELYRIIGCYKWVDKCGHWCWTCLLFLRDLLLLTWCVMFWAYVCVWMIFVCNATKPCILKTGLPAQPFFDATVRHIP